MPYVAMIFLLVVGVLDIVQIKGLENQVDRVTVAYEAHLYDEYTRAECQQLVYLPEHDEYRACARKMLERAKAEIKTVAAAKK